MNRDKADYLLEDPFFKMSLEKVKINRLSTHRPTQRTNDTKEQTTEL